MTYRQLLEKLKAMSDEQLDGMDVTVFLMETDEVFPVTDFVTDWSTDREAKGVDQVEGVLDDDHPYLIVLA